MRQARRLARFIITNKLLDEALHRQFGMPHNMHIVGTNPYPSLDGLEVTVTSTDLPLVEEGFEIPLVNPTIEAVTEQQFVMHFEDA